MTRPPDLAYEALAEVTSTDWNTGRGKLNSALAEIKAQWNGSDDELPAEIKERGRLYRRLMPGVVLTPNALAQHWMRVFEEAHRKETTATNQSAPYHECSCCGGHEFVVYSLRPMVETIWMRERGFHSRGEIEEMAACPECSTVDASFRRYDGAWARVPDAERVKEMMSR